MLGFLRTKQNPEPPKKFLIALLPESDKSLLKTIANLSGDDEVIPALVEAIMALPNEEALDVAGTLLQLRFQTEPKFQNKDLAVALIISFLCRSSFPLSETNRAKLKASSDETLLKDFLALFASPSEDYVRFFMPLYQTRTWGLDFDFYSRMWPLFYKAIIKLDGETRQRLQKISPQLIQKDQQWLSPLFQALQNGKPSAPQISADTLKILKDIVQPPSEQKDSELQSRIEELANIAEFLAKEFPANSPLANEFFTLRDDLDDYAESFQKGQMSAASIHSEVTNRIAPYVNICIAHLTPLQRLSQGNPSLTEEELTKYVNRLIQEGADAEATTTNYPASWQVSMKDAWQGAPWPRQMAAPLVSVVPKTCLELSHHFEPRLTPLYANLRKQKAQEQEAAKTYVQPEEWNHDWRESDDNKDRTT
jgi:hypothetical protein